MKRSRLKPVAEVSVGAWIAPRLGHFGGWVGSVAPRGYAAYARVLHPVPDDHDAIRWAEVCAATGRSSKLIAAVLAEPALEAWPVDPDDSLAHDGDTLNT